MKPFLDSVIDELFVQYPENIGDLCLVLPNRRAGLFIKKYISKKINRPTFLPEIFGIEDFVNQLDKEVIPDDLVLLHELYKSYCDINSDKPQSFDYFYQWGNVLLHDFNDIDYNLADAQSIFFYLSAEKKIQEWTPENTDLSSFQKNYLQFYENLFKVYTLFKTTLFVQGLAYQGMKYRYVAENINDLAESITWRKIVFIGFNALTVSENVIIDSLIKAGKADIYWDSDDYYLKQPIQEAGKFIRQHFKNSNWGEFKWSFNHYKEAKKNITLYPVTQNTMQVKTAGTLLVKMDSESTDITKTAVVLADEKLLMPLIHSLPENIQQCNVTMGYSLNFHNYNEFIQQLFSLYENSRQQQFYFQDVINIFNNSYFCLFTKINPKIITAFIATIRDNKKLFYNTDEIINYVLLLAEDADEKAENMEGQNNEDVIKEVKEIFNIKDDKAARLLQKMIGICEKILQDDAHGAELRNQLNGEEQEFVFQFSKILSHLHKIVEGLQTEIEVHTLQQMVQQIIKNTTIAFYGEPLSGLQIMGMLETRTLDFENIILLSANEDMLPKSKLQPSFIPYDIRKTFNLPTFVERDAIFAYHFYRLLQRAKQVHIIYNTESGNFSSGEKSRFVTQLLEELPHYNAKISIEVKKIKIPNLNTGVKQKLEVAKNHAIVDGLLERLKNGFSPSALSTYITCPLRFYYRYCVGINEIKPVSASIDAREFGNVLHETLDKLYNPYVAKIITAQTLTEIRKIATLVLEEELAKVMQTSQQESGSNRITGQVAKKILEEYLKNEMLLLGNSTNQYQLIACEQEIKCNKQVFANNKKFTLLLQGKIDKLMLQLSEKNVKMLVIADYKTGNVTTSELKFTSWNDLICMPDKAKIFQLFCYASMVNSNNDVLFDGIQPGIIPLRNNKTIFIPVGLQQTVEEDEEQLEEKTKSEKNTKNTINFFSKAVIQNNFNSLLDQLLTEILTIDIPFSATADENQCSLCPYNSVCFNG